MCADLDKTTSGFFISGLNFLAILNAIRFASEPPVVKVPKICFPPKSSPISEANSCSKAVVPKNNPGSPKFLDIYFMQISIPKSSGSVHIDPKIDPESYNLSNFNFSSSIRSISCFSNPFFNMSFNNKLVTHS
ncbi:hypothetical protein ES705_49403 [subsurface metagenome]